MDIDNYGDTYGDKEEEEEEKEWDDGKYCNLVMMTTT